MVLVVMQASVFKRPGAFQWHHAPCRQLGKEKDPMHTIRRMSWLIALSLVVRLLPMDSP